MRVECNVAGTSFRLKDDPNYGQLRPSGLAVLEAEPSNKYDPNAIKVMLGDVFLGYIPGPKSKWPEVQAECLKLMAGDEPYQVEIKDYCYRDEGGFNNDHRGSLSAITLSICSGGDGTVRERDGKVYDRISQVVGYFDPGDKTFLARWMINKFKTFEQYQQYMAETADEGTATHAALEAYFKSGKVDAANLPSNLGEFTSKHKIEPVSFEERLYDDETMLSGQFDMLAKVDGKLTVVDWKRAKNVYPKHKMQASFYSAVKGREIGEPIGGMIVAWGGGPAVATLTPEQCGWGYEVVKLIRRAEKSLAML